MKKIIRIAALALCAVMLCSVLCSCAQLDEMRNNRATRIDKTSFTFRGKTYKKLELPEGMNFIINSIYSENTYLTEEDVPVMLGSMYGDTMFFDRSQIDDPVVIGVSDKFHGVDSYPFFSSRSAAALADRLDEYEDYYYFAPNQIEYYVREDKIDSVTESVKNAAIDHYYVEVYEYEDPEKTWEGGKYTNVVLSDETCEAINRTLKDGEPTAREDLDSNAQWYEIWLYPCDKDYVLTTELDGSTARYIVTDTFNYYVYRAEDYETLYKASDEDFELLRKVYSMCKDSLGYFDPDWY